METAMKKRVGIILFTLLMLLWGAGSLGLAQEEEDDFSDEGEETGLFKGIEFSGFGEIEQGINITGDGPHRDAAEADKLHWMLANRRFRIKTSKTGDKGGVFIKIDFIRDEVIDKTYIDLRELRLQYRLFSWLDVSVGRQVATWGVADMLFINDLFPKNWVANFQGRDNESLKDSSTSLRLTSYFGKWTLDMVYHPKFSPDTTPTGCYFSVYDPNSGRLIANPGSCGEGNASEKVSNNVQHEEIAVSLKRRLPSQEVALYGYSGPFKNPRILPLCTGGFVTT